MALTVFCFGCETMIDTPANEQGQVVCPHCDTIVIPRRNINA